MLDTINWARCHTRPLLMTPGPTELAPPVSQAMSQPPQTPYGSSFDDVFEATTLSLRQIFQTTRSDVIILPGSGRTAIEAGAQAVIEPGDSVVVVVAGVFAGLTREILARLGADVTEFHGAWGQPLDVVRLAEVVDTVRPRAVVLVHNESSTGTTYPAAEVGRIADRVGALYLLDTVSSLAGLDVRTDEWNVDVNMSGSQKCFGAPLGLGLLAVSPRAWERIARRRVRPRGYVYDLLRWREWWLPASRGGRRPDHDPCRYPMSMPTQLLSAAAVAGRLVLEEGLTNRFQRHEVAATALRSGLSAMGLDLFPEASVASNTVTCVNVPVGVGASAVLARMRDHYGVVVGHAHEHLHASTLRIGTMNLTASPPYVLPTLSALELTLRDLGGKCEGGAGVAAAQLAFAALSTLVSSPFVTA
jgi:(S)-ureidoglycine-glyoxylate aminotransferase